MKVEVVFTGDFRADLVEQTRHLLAEDRLNWAERLIGEVEAAARLLGHSPGACPLELRRRGKAIRRLVLRRLPFVVWYHWDAKARRAVVLGLFHVRQRR
jgi:plasmid stabilization system protein ParE